MVVLRWRRPVNENPNLVRAHHNLARLILYDILETQYALEKIGSARPQDYSVAATHSHPHRTACTAE